MRSQVRVVLVLAIILIAMFFVSETFAWGKKKGNNFHYEFESGWSIVKIIPAEDTRRVNDFESMFADTPEHLKQALDYGNFFLFAEMHKVGYKNWWAIVVDIPSDYFLHVPQNASIIMEGVDKEGDTLYVESVSIAFAKGWVADYKNARQHTVLYSFERGFQVKSSQDPGRNDFEWSDLGVRNGPKYVVGYVYFGPDVKVEKIVGFHVKGIDAYPVRVSQRR